MSHFRRHAPADDVGFLAALIGRAITEFGADPAQLQVELLRIDGGGHTGSSRTENLPWPLRKLLGEMNHDEDTAEAAWVFFE